LEGIDVISTNFESNFDELGSFSLGKSEALTNLSSVETNKKPQQN
jgi:hypothetical protein